MHYFFMKSFISLLFIHTILFPLIPIFPPLRLLLCKPSLLPYAMHCVALVVVVEGLALCHHLGTRALDPSSVLDYWWPAENMFTLEFYCAERGLEPKFDQNGSLKKNSQGVTDRQTRLLTTLRVLFT